MINYPAIVQTGLVKDSVEVLRPIILDRSNKLLGIYVPLLWKKLNFENRRTAYSKHEDKHNRSEYAHNANLARSYVNPIQKYPTNCFG